MRQIKRRVRRGEGVPSAGRGGFVELLAREDDVGAPSAIEIDLPSGHRLRLQGEVDVALVARLASALTRC